jgi:outer membrane receptor protein involved in Fe transport
MEYANIAIYSNSDSKLVTGSIADEKGSFEIGGLPFGEYYIEANFIGFEKSTIKDVKVLQNTATINVGTIELNASREQINTVDVVVERNRVEYKIDKKVINVTNDINASGGSAVTVLENTPSVEVDMDGNVSLRGSSSFTVLIDGRPSVLSGSDALRQIPSAAIQNIEIITNPSAKYDPDGMAGIINVVMKKNVLSGFNGIVNLNVGSGQRFGTDMMVNYKTKKFNYFLGGNYTDNTDEGTMKMTRETNINDTTTYLNTNGLRNQTRGGQQIKGGIDYYVSENTSITIAGEIGKYNSDSEGGGDLHQYTEPQTIDVYTVQDNNSSRNGKYFSSTSSFLTKFDESGLHKLEGTFYYRDRNSVSSENIDEFFSDKSYNQTGEYTSRVTTTEDSQSKDIRVKLDYTHPFENGSKFEAGFQSRLERETELFNFKNYDPITGDFVNNPLFTSDMIFKEDIHGAYSTFSGKLKSVEYMLGLRGEYTDRSIEHSKVNTPYTLNRFDLFPSLHFSYQLTEMNQLMASYSRRIDRPDGRDLDPFPSYMNQYTIRIGNPELKPEYSDSYELSAIHKFGESYISLETFYRTTNDLMTRVQELGDDGIIYMSTQNLNRDHSLGGELMGNFNVNKWLLINASFTLYNYRLEGEVLGKPIDKQSTNYSSRLNGTFKFSDNARMQLTAYYRGPSASAQGDMKGMFYSNLSYRQEFMKKKLSATLGIQDIFGTGKYEGTSYGDNFKSSFKMQREPRVLLLTLSYKINNYKMGKPDNEDQSGESMDESGF